MRCSLISFASLKEGAVMRRQRGQQDQAKARRRRRKHAAYARAFTIEIEGAQYAQLGRQRDAIGGQKYQSGAAAKANAKAALVS
jgi:hypothetical protein